MVPIRPEDIGLEPLEEEKIPDAPPHPGIAVGIEDPEARAILLKGVRLKYSLGSDLMRSSFRLAEMAKVYSGRFEEGFEVPESGRAAAAGAIAIAAATVEASLNDLIALADWEFDQNAVEPRSILVRLSVKHSPLKRFEALRAICGFTTDWSSEPFQSLDLLFSVRRHLLHHEGKVTSPAEGLWPAKRLRDLARQLNTPFEIDPDNVGYWHHHILTPDGAHWAVNVAAEILELVDEMERVLDPGMSQEAESTDGG